mmetsp:Transcript_93939/g.235832  ORF Transcript_93939/g.235832 Transcript_93939/m.235832 type:complete len:224 (-) Transcript_93939:1914-2585(-)
MSGTRQMPPTRTATCTVLAQWCSCLPTAASLAAGRSERSRRSPTWRCPAHRVSWRNGRLGLRALRLAAVVGKKEQDVSEPSQQAAGSRARAHSSRASLAEPRRAHRRIACWVLGTLGALAPTTRSNTGGARSRRSLQLVAWLVETMAAILLLKRPECVSPRRWIAWSLTGRHGTIATEVAEGASSRGTGRSCCTLRAAVRRARRTCGSCKVATRSHAMPWIAS